MSVHDSKDWEATETTDMVGQNRSLIVTGKVQVGAGNEEPVLTEASPQGINPSVLILELSTEMSGDVGTDVLTWKDARYRRLVSEHEFSQVEIRGQATVDVVEAHA